MKRSRIIIYLFIAGLLLLTGCADVQNVNYDGEPAGFWWGLWHGLFAVISFIGSLFSDDIAIYAVNNNGGWYDFGYLLGVGAIANFFGD